LQAQALQDGGVRGFPAALTRDQMRGDRRFGLHGDQRGHAGR